MVHAVRTLGPSVKKLRRPSSSSVACPGLSLNVNLQQTGTPSVHHIKNDQLLEASPSWTAVLHTAHHIWGASDNGTMLAATEPYLGGMQTQTAAMTGAQHQHRQHPLSQPTAAVSRTSGRCAPG